MNKPEALTFLVEGVEVSISNKEITIHDHKSEVTPKKGELICEYLCDEDFLPYAEKLTFHILRPR